MQNFFNSNSNSESTPLNTQYGDMKDNYQQIFIEAAESIRSELEKLKPENPCTLCQVNKCEIKVKDPFADFPIGCAYRDWQKQILTFLSGDYKQKLRNIYKNIMDKKCEYECIKCGNCCRLAVSEYSFDQLKQRAARGDKFSRDFISVFVPYETEQDAQNANPEFFELFNEVSEQQKVYYYYCPKLKGNQCSDYENRPDICREFPHNPLKLLPSTCSFNEWKKAVSHSALLLKAKTDIIAFYQERLG